MCGSAKNRCPSGPFFDLRPTSTCKQLLLLKHLSLRIGTPNATANNGSTEASIGGKVDFCLWNCPVPFLRIALQRGIVAAMGPVTQILSAIEQGDPQAAHEL